LAARGLRDLDSGPERIAESADLETVQRQAQRVKLKTLVVAVVLTALVLLIP
jgi:hypothetical protein